MATNTLFTDFSSHSPHSFTTRRQQQPHSDSFIMSHQDYMIPSSTSSIDLTYPAYNLSPVYYFEDWSWLLEMTHSTNATPMHTSPFVPTTTEISERPYGVSQNPPNVIHSVSSGSISSSLSSEPLSTHDTNFRKPILRRQSSSSCTSSSSSSNSSNISASSNMDNHNGKSGAAVGSRAHPCPFCTRTFARRHDLERHTRVHTGIKPYVCPCCLKGFPRSDARGRHFRNETACRFGPQVLAWMKRNMRNTL